MIPTGRHAKLFLHKVISFTKKDTEGDMINTLHSGISFNMMKMLQKIYESAILVLNDIVEKMIWKCKIQINHYKY